MTVKTFLGFALSFAVIVSCTKEGLEQGKTGNFLPSFLLKPLKVLTHAFLTS